MSKRRRPDALNEATRPEAVVAVISEVEAFLESGDLRSAESGIQQLGALACLMNERDAGELRAMIRPLRDRLDQGKLNVRYRGEANPAPRVLRCLACHENFEQAVDEGWRKRCQVCEPPRGSSIRAASAGLPTLGQRRR